MEITRMKKEAFSVIGREGSTESGPGFVGKLWEEANSRFAEISHLAKKTPDGNLTGLWGLMSDPGRNFLPWEDNFSRGLYLAGVEALDGADVPEGWTMWTAPASDYVKVKIAGNPGEGFQGGLDYLKEQGLALVGAVYDFNAPDENGQLYMLFPVARL